MISTILLIVLIAYAIIITYNYIITRMKLFEQQSKFLIEIRALQEEIKEMLKEINVCNNIKTYRSEYVLE